MGSAGRDYFCFVCSVFGFIITIIYELFLHFGVSRNVWDKYCVIIPKPLLKTIFHRVVAVVDATAVADKKIVEKSKFKDKLDNF